MSNNHDNENQKHYNDIMKGGAAVSGIGAILPYAVLAGAGLYLYKKYGDDVEDVFSGAGAAGGITETVNNITESISKTTESVTTFIENNTLDAKERTDIEQEAAGFSVGSGAGVKLPKLTGEQEQFISKYSDDKTKTRNFRESPYLNLGLGPDTSPLKRSMMGLDDKTLEKAMSYKSKKVQSPQQAQGLTPMAAKGAKPDIRTSDKNLKKPKIIKKKEQDKFQRAGLTPMAARGV